jgi:hypothetical protein
MFTEETSELELDGKLDVARSAGRTYHPHRTRFFTVTSASGITAFEGSVTVPTMLPVVACPRLGWLLERDRMARKRSVSEMERWARHGALGTGNGGSRRCNIYQAAGKRKHESALSCFAV